MKLYLLLTLSIFASLAPAKSIRNRHALHVRHEKRNPSSHWVKREAVDPDLALPMRIGLAQNNLERGHDLLMETSDPMSPKYGQHYTAQQVHDIFAPSEDSINSVRMWLKEAGISEDRIALSDNRQWLGFDISAWEAESLLKTKYHIYEHGLTGKLSVGCREYHVRRDIQHHIDYITPGVTGHAVRKLADDEARAVTRRKIKARRPSVDESLPLVERASPTTTATATTNVCNTATVSPACVQSIYSIPRGTTAIKGNELGIYQPDTANPDPKAANIFWTEFAPYIPNGTFPTFDGIDGATFNLSQGGSGESNLDMQTSWPIIWPQSETYFLVDSYYEVTLQKPRYGFLDTFIDGLDKSFCTYSAFGQTGDNNTVDPIYPNKQNKFNLQCGVYTPTNVISISYLSFELGDYLAPNYYERQCNEFMKLGLQGVSVIVPAGDSGPEGGGVAATCGTANGHSIYNPAYPAGCQYVTSVGGTSLSGSAGNYYETAPYGFSSGGGFSTIFASPSYQSSAVKSFFASSNAPSFPSYSGSKVGNGIYNSSGRGYPDVAAFSENMPVVLDIDTTTLYGTSFATPIFAAILTRINEERLAANKSTVGFVNPVLYQNPQAFTDITSGKQAGTFCNNTPGFSTAVGWDPVTGLGSPNYPVLLNVFMNT